MENIDGTDLNVVNVLPRPVGAHEQVAESEDKQVLDHLLSEVVVDAENLLLLPVGLQRALELAGALQVLAEWLLNLVDVCEWERSFGKRAYPAKRTMMRAMPLFG